MEAVRPPIAPSGAIAYELAEFSQATLAIRSRIAVLDCNAGGASSGAQDPFGRPALSQGWPRCRVRLTSVEYPAYRTHRILDLVSEFIDEDASSDVSRLSTRSEDEFNFAREIRYANLFSSGGGISTPSSEDDSSDTIYCDHLRLSEASVGLCLNGWSLCVVLGGSIVAMPKDILKRWKSREQEDRHSGSLWRDTVTD